MLTDSELTEGLAALDGWRREGAAIVKQFTFADFRAAMWFLNCAAAVADAMDHHPEWTNVYSRVTVRLTTHDAGGVTEKDLVLAEAMDSLANG